MKDPDLKGRFYQILAYVSTSLTCFHLLSNLHYEYIPIISFLVLKVKGSLQSLKLCFACITFLKGRSFDKAVISCFKRMSSPDVTSGRRPCRSLLSLYSFSNGGGEGGSRGLRESGDRSYFLFFYFLVVIISKFGLDFFSF